MEFRRELEIRDMKLDELYKSLEEILDKNKRVSIFDRDELQYIILRIYVRIIEVKATVPHIENVWDSKCSSASSSLRDLKRYNGKLRERLREMDNIGEIRESTNRYRNRTSSIYWEY